MGIKEDTCHHENRVMYGRVEPLIHHSSILRIRPMETGQVVV